MGSVKRFIKQAQQQIQLPPPQYLEYPMPTRPRDRWEEEAPPLSPEEKEESPYQDPWVEPEKTSSFTTTPGLDVFLPILSEMMDRANVPTIGNTNVYEPEAIKSIYNLLAPGFLEDEGVQRDWINLYNAYAPGEEEPTFADSLENIWPDLNVFDYYGISPESRYAINEYVGDQFQAIPPGAPEEAVIEIDDDSDTGDAVIEKGGSFLKQLRRLKK